MLHARLCPTGSGGVAVGQPHKWDPTFPPKQTCAAGRGSTPSSDGIWGQWQDSLCVHLPTPLKGLGCKGVWEVTGAWTERGCGRQGSHGAPQSPTRQHPPKQRPVSRMWRNSGMWSNRKRLPLAGWEPNDMAQKSRERKDFQ